MIDARDERRARLLKTATFPAGNPVHNADLRAELEASERDRKALAGARDLLERIGGWTASSAELPPEIVGFLKRTEPADD